MSPLAREGVLLDSARDRLASHGPTAPESLARVVFGLSRIEPELADRLLGALLGGDPAFERLGGTWRLAPSSPLGPPRRIDTIPFVVVDVETTGGRPPGHRVIEIGAVRVRGGRIEAEWSSLVDPGRPVPAFVRRLTGIGTSETDAAPAFGSVADPFLAFLGGAPFVGHNAIFDWRFVNAELLRCRGGRLTNARICTVRLARRLLPHVKRRNLDALAHLFGVTVRGRHRALGDARAAAEILLRLLELAVDGGIEDEVALGRLCGAGGTLYPGPA